MLNFLGIKAVDEEFVIVGALAVDAERHPAGPLGIVALGGVTLGALSGAGHQHHQLGEVAAVQRKVADRLAFHDATNLGVSRLQRGWRGVHLDLLGERSDLEAEINSGSLINFHPYAGNQFLETGDFGGHRVFPGIDLWEVVETVAARHDRAENSRRGRSKCDFGARNGASCRIRDESVYSACLLPGERQHDERSRS